MFSTDELYGDNPLISHCHYGFCAKYLTELAIHLLTDSKYEPLGQELHQITIFCDFSKAFDAMSHDSLLHKSFKCMASSASLIA